MVRIATTALRSIQGVCTDQTIFPEVCTFVNVVLFKQMVRLFCTYTPQNHSRKKHWRKNRNIVLKKALIFVWFCSTC